jgi:hypothetical protein
MIKGDKATDRGDFTSALPLYRKVVESKNNFPMRWGTFYNYGRSISKDQVRAAPEDIAFLNRIIKSDEPMLFRVYSAYCLGMHYHFTFDIYRFLNHLTD